MIFALISALISGFSVFINKFGVTIWHNASVYTTAKNIVAAIFLTALLLAIRNYKELKQLSKITWLKLAGIGFIGGSVPFLLFFTSLTMISAPEAAFIQKTLFLWVALLAFPFLKERLNVIQCMALGILLYGAFLFDTPTHWTMNKGVLLALSATILWAIENIIAKRVLENVSAITLGWARMFFGSIFLLIYLVLTGQTAAVIPSSFQQAGWALLVGGILFLYVTFWYSALAYAPATVVTSILVIAVPITALLNALFVTHAVPFAAVKPAALIIIGGLLFLATQYERISSQLTRRTKTAFS